MEISRSWAMPNKNTFEVKPIKFFISKYNKIDLYSIDPFANKNKLAKVTNDLNHEFETDYNLDALEFLNIFENESVDLVFFDPPFSPRQVSECYKLLNMTVNFETTQASFWSDLKKEISRIVKPNGIVLSFGWNTGGIGKKYGFIIEEIKIVAHGGQHNDTLCTMERKFTKSIF